MPARVAEVAAKRQDLLDRKPVLRFNVSPPDLQVVKISQVVSRPELMEDICRVYEVREELAEMIPALVGDARLLRYP